jgi:hypothetical protein
MDPERGDAGCRDRTSPRRRQGAFQAGLGGLRADRFEPEEIIDAGDDTFVVRVLIAARGKASEAQLDARMYQVMRFKDDMLFRLNWYSTRDEALEAADLKE